MLTNRMPGMYRPGLLWVVAAEITMEDLHVPMAQGINVYKVHFEHLGTLVSGEGEKVGRA